MKILLFDGYSILNRAFYALPMLSNSEGEYTNAVYGFLNIFFRFIDEEKPDFVTVAFDLPQPTFRHAMYGAYKGTRKGMPDELRAQVPTLKTLLEKMCVTTAECAGFEADDVIGTLTAKAVAQGIKPVIITGDRDLLQLASDEVKIRLPKTKAGKTEVEDYNAEQVVAKYGVSPSAYVDVKALMGDTSDNIPGVPGIGEVTATKIIAAYGSLENAIANVSEIKPKKAAENLAQFTEQALLSRALAAVSLDAPVELVLAGTENIQNEDALAEVRRLELRSLYKRFEGVKTLKTNEVEAEEIKTLAQAEKMFSDIKEAAFFSWDEGFAIAAPEPKYIRFGGELTLMGSADEVSEADFIALAKPWLESDSPKYVFDAKAEITRLRRYGITPRGIEFDATLSAYVLDALHQVKTPGDIAEIYLNEDASHAADIIFRARPVMEEKMKANGQEKLFREIELPLAGLLAEMEAVGIRVDKQTLSDFGAEMDKRLSALTALIYDFAGEEFNINSPAQLGEILFDKLGLKGGKKTQKGFSTAADVLEKLKSAHPIVPLVLEFRACSKLKSTYADGMIPLINHTTKRIHTTFHQNLTATGRLSSAEPNLQNIPIRTELGRELRKAFVPAEGCVFLDADYSQIELRLLAHMSGDEVLINAFRENQDIHRLTASQVLGVPPEEITSEQRSNAKAVNFGIVYGISAFGLSEDLKIPVKTAENYIKGYFEKYPGVKDYLDKTIAQAKKDGFVSTLYNRRRAMPELKSPHFNTRSFGERVAMNMPIQGTAADIIKIAMLRVASRLKRENLRARIILQVHDELLLEAPKEESETVRHILKEEMECAATLSVPLAADVNVGESWYATK